MGEYIRMVHERLIEMYEAREDLKFTKYIHADDEEGALAVTYGCFDRHFK